MEKEVKRNFIIGDEWIYFKIYTGIKTSDLILTDYLYPVLKKMTQKEYIDKWFFIRYHDPSFHLRLRLHITDEKYLSEIIKEINLCLKDFLNLDLIWKIQLDTYNRELERYGHKSIESSESLFYHDSEMITNALMVIEEHENQNMKWLFGLMAVDALMKDFNLSLEGSKNLMEDLKNNFGSEMGIDSKMKKQLSMKYQKHKVEIYNFFNSNEALDTQSKFLMDLIKVKSTSISKEITFIKENNNDFNSLSNIIASHIHMIMNRLFRIRNREAEFVCYQMLYYYYESVIARNKYNTAITHE